jgi:hypothetical protein
MKRHRATGADGDSDSNKNREDLKDLEEMLLLNHMGTGSRA